MTLHEANDRLKKEKIETEDEFWQIQPLYILLDLDKDIFCKIVDVAGLETLKNKSSWYKRLQTAEAELTAKEKYVKAKSELEEIKHRSEELKNSIAHYEKNMKYYT